MEKEKMNLGGVLLESKKKKRKVGIGILSIVLVLILLLGLSYAFFTLTLNGTKQNVIKVGKLSLVLDENMGEGIQLENAVPTPIETALSGSSYTFTVTNDGTVSSNYAIYLDNQDTTNTNLDWFCYALKKDGKIVYLNTMDTNKLNSPMISGIMNPGENSIYELYLWVDYNATISSTSNLHFEGKIRVEANQQREQRLSTLVMHTCDGIDNCTREHEGITYFQQGYYAKAEAKKYVWYSGKLWIVTSYDSEGNVKAITESEVTKMPWGTTLDYQGSYVESWINEEFLPTLNNYQNLLVLDYPWNYSHENEGSGYQASRPIGNDKIGTGPVGLLNKEDLYYASDMNDNFNGLDLVFGNLGLGEYFYTGTVFSQGTLFVGSSLYYTYALNSTRFAGVSPAVVFRNDVKIVSGTGTRKDPYLLKGDSQGATGDLLNTRCTGEYIAFGEGVNTSYRISKVENGLTKIVSTWPLLSIEITESKETIKQFNQSVYNNETYEISYPYSYSTTGNLNRYDATSLEYPIAYYLNHDFLNPINGFLSKGDLDMIALNQKWYPGLIDGFTNYLSLRTDSNANIATVGLLSLGEAYNITSSHDRLTATILSYEQKESEPGILFVNDGSQFYDDRFDYSTIPNGSIRPSMYLKETIRIKSGTGTKEDPYILYY